jgi:hypothetical protein
MVIVDEVVGAGVAVAAGVEVVDVVGIAEGVGVVDGVELHAARTGTVSITMTSTMNRNLALMFSSFTILVTLP